jgi:hypothetical protein
VVTSASATDSALSRAMLPEAAEKPMPVLDEINQREPVGGLKKE